MFARLKIRRALNSVLGFAFEAGVWNKELVKEKISFYKQWKRQSRNRNTVNNSITDNYIANSSKTIKIQIDRFGLMNSFLFKLRYIDVSKLTKQFNGIVSSLDQARQLLEALLKVLQQELDVLNSYLSPEEKMKQYAKFFHVELGIYKRFQSLSKGLNPEVFIRLREDISRSVESKSPVRHIIEGKQWKEAGFEVIKASTLTIIAYACMGYIVKQFIEVSLEEIEKIVFMAFFSAGLLDLLNQFEYYAAKLYELRKIEKSTI